MSRGTAGWLSCATVVFVLHTLGFSSPFAKQIIFAVFALLHIRSDISVGSIISLSLGYLQYAVILLGSFLLARCLLATANSPRPAGPGQVMLFPCKTTHSRLFPKKHSFVYSYLVVGIPVGWEGISGGLVSSYSGKQSWLSFSGRGWYHVDPADYLNRGDGQLGLRGKLDAYLKSQVRAMKIETNGFLFILWLTSERIGCRPRGLSLRLPGYGREILGIPFQSCVLLVPVFGRHVAWRHGSGG